MTKAEAVEQFKETVLPSIFKRHGTSDEPALSEAWNNWTDGLCKDGEITDRQYANWIGPRITKSDWIRAAVLVSNHPADY